MARMGRKPSEGNQLLAVGALEGARAEVLLQLGLAVAAELRKRGIEARFSLDPPEAAREKLPPSKGAA